MLLLAACQTPPRPLYTSLPEDDRRAELMLRTWAEHVSGRQGLRASARLAVDGREGEGPRLRARQALWLSRPSAMRVEIHSPLRTTLAVLVTDGLQYSVDTADGRREMGNVDRSLLWEVAYLDLSPAEAVDVILGFGGLGEGLLPGRSYAGPEGHLRLDLVRPDGAPARTVDFEPSGLLARVETRLPGGGSWVVTASAYEDVGGSPVAHRIEIESAHSQAALMLSRVELNPELPPDTFRVDGGWTGMGEGG